MHPSEPDFETLVADAGRGDDHAWRSLYHAHAPAVLGYLRAQRAPSPEDLLGEVWLQAVRDLPRFAGSPAGFRSWLLTIAHHRLLDARRRIARRPDESGSPAAIEHVAGVDDDVAARHQSERELIRILDGLPVRQRSVLYLRYVLDLPQHEVARILGMRTPALKMLQARAKRALRARLVELDATEPGAVALPSESPGRWE